MLGPADPLFTTYSDPAAIVVVPEGTTFVCRYCRKFLGSAMTCDCEASRSARPRKASPGAIESRTEVARKLAGWIEHSRAELQLHLMIPIDVAEYLHELLLDLEDQEISAGLGDSRGAAAAGLENSAGLDPVDRPGVAAPAEGEK